MNQESRVGTMNRSGGAPCGSGERPFGSRSDPSRVAGGFDARIETEFERPVAERRLKAHGFERRSATRPILRAHRALKGPATFGRSLRDLGGGAPAQVIGRKGGRGGVHGWSRSNRSGRFSRGPTAAQGRRRVPEPRIRLPGKAG